MMFKGGILGFIKSGIALCWLLFKKNNLNARFCKRKKLLKSDFELWPQIAIP